MSVADLKVAPKLGPTSWAGPPEIDPSEITPDVEIGSGTFGRVLKGHCRSKDVCIKILHKQKFDQKTLEAFRKEVGVVSHIFHPNICLFMGACTIPGKCMIVTELLPKGDLEKLLRNHSIELSLTLRMQMAVDAALGMTWLHESNPVFLHRDLKTSNLLVDENYRVKICDFGLTQLKQKEEMLRDTQSAKGTPLWMAPEVMLFKEFNEKADVYSFGIVLWEILTRKEPFAHHKKFDQFRNAICNLHERPAIPDDCPPRLRTLITNCWAPDQKTRPAFREIVTTLMDVVVDVAISDETGRKIWRDNHLDLKQVGWEDFWTAFCNTLKIDKATPSSSAEVSRDCLKAITTYKNYDGAEDEDVVRIERFGQVLDWVGPCNEKMLAKVQELVSKKWFHGEITAHEAQSLLNDLPAGTFLVRFSSTQRGAYTISQVSDDCNFITHQRVQHTPGEGYHYSGQRYDSMQQLIVENAEKQKLKLACPGSKFQTIFTKAPAPYLGYQEPNANQ